MSYGAGYAEGVKVARSDDDVKKIMAGTKDLDLDAKAKFLKAYNELFTHQYPFVDKVATSFHLPLVDVLAIQPERPDEGDVRVYTGRAPYPNGSDGSGRAHYINPKEDRTLDSIKRDTSLNHWTITNTYATSLSRELRSDVSKEYRHPRQGLGIGRLLHSQGVRNSISKQCFK
ncbi:hypothetical protein Tco_1404197 [Tanacetum coccineum]